MARDTQEEDSAASPRGEELAQQRGQVGIVGVADVYWGGDSTQQYAKNELGCFDYMKFYTLQNFLN